MANFNALPSEILEKIVMSIPGRPFKTELLLLNKVLCYHFMTEQIRKLVLRDQQLDRFIAIISNNDVKRPCSISLYCNLLDKMYGLVIHIREMSSQEAVTKLVSRCTSLRCLFIKSGNLLWNINNVMIGLLSANIAEIRLTPMKLEEGDEEIRALAEYLRRSTKLAELKLFGIFVGLKGAQILAECLKQSLTLTSLELYNNEIGIEGVHNLFKGLCLKQNTILTHLEISYNGIDNGSVRVLADDLKHNVVLKNLNLSENSISTEGAYALAECLKQNRALTDLNLSSNDISDDGVCALAESFEYNIALTNLNLKRNRIGDEGAGILVEGLKQNSTLTNLNLSYNHIRDEGACTLADGLEYNTTLTDLNLSYNSIGSHGISALARCLNQNTTLISLNLKENNPTDAHLIEYLQDVKRIILF